MLKEIGRFSPEFTTGVAQIKATLIKWLIPLMFAQVAVIAAPAKLG